MRAVMLEVPQALLDERRARGAYRWDEMWEGELKALGIRAETVGGTLRLTWEGGSAGI